MSSIGFLCEKADVFQFIFLYRLICILFFYGMIFMPRRFRVTRFEDQYAVLMCMGCTVVMHSSDYDIVPIIIPVKTIIR